MAAWSLATALSSACSRQAPREEAANEAAHPLAAPDTGRWVVDSAPTPPTVRPGLKYLGELGRPLDAYLAAPDDFMKLVHAQEWSGYERPRRCDDDPQCLGANPQKRARMRVQAIGDAHKVNYRDADRNGVMLARIINVRDRRDAVYGFLPSPNGFTIERYLLVLPDGAQQFIVLAYRGNGKHPRLSVEPIGRPLEPCGDSLPSAAPKADFSACGRHGAGPAGAARAYETDLAWMTCSYGCCSSAFPLVPGTPRSTGDS